MWRIPRLRQSRALVAKAWLAVALLMMLLFAKTSRAAERLTGEVSVGRKLYQNRCAKCHKMYDPAKYSDKEWEGWMLKMDKKAKLRPEQREAVDRYVQENLRRPRAKPDDRREGATKQGQKSP
jgi:mono/diheme cytochrome c family protein